MAYFVALGLLSLAGIVGTVWLVRTDGYGRIPTDRSRVAPTEPAAAPAEEVAAPARPATAAITVPRPGRLA